MKKLSLLFVAAAMLATNVSIDAADDPRGIEFFEKKIRPILVKHCYECHSAKAKKVKGGLLLDSKAGVTNGGDSGPVIDPDSVEKSLFLQAVRHEDKDLAMPQKYKLKDFEISNLVKWLKMGAPDPRKGGGEVAVKSGIDAEKDRQFWAFVPPKKIAAPRVKNTSWPTDDIDRFVLSKAEEKKLSPVRDADRHTLIRRATYDLTGLPPTPKEVEDFVNDRASGDKAFAKVVDRLLASPHFGERWGRHWLDVVRYAESTGRSRNYPFQFAWRYRDYVIKSLNEDKLYDRFIIEQIAGDLLPHESNEQRDDQRTATAFLALGSKDLNERDSEQYRMDEVDDQIDTTGRSMLALTLACARCHNHKFDPIPTKDYYSIAGIFRSTIVLNGYKNRGTGGNKGYGKSEMLYPVAFEGSKPEADAKQRELASAQKRASQLQREMKTLRRRIAEIKAFMKQKTPKDPKERVGFSQKKKDAAKEQRDLQLKIRKLTQQLKKAQLKKGKVGGKIVGEFTMGVRDVDSPADCKLNVRGDPHNLGTAVPRGFVQVISTPGSERIESPKDSGRLELAKWIASPQNPMTARVMVNRIWSHLFGRGIVRTVDNFGEMGARPTHPQLLDHLALRFVDHGFSMKKMIRQIMLTHTYRLGNDHHAGNYEIDPDDVYLWRANQRRVDVEMLRDAILMVSGKLDPTPAQGSPVRNMNTGEVRRGESASDAIFKSNHRSVYLPIVRSYLPEIHQTFDFPVPSEVKGQREVTTVALQALYMMNSRFVIDQAKSAAEKLLSKNMSSSDRATRVYMQTVGRTPNADELRAVVDYVDGVINSRGKVKSPGLVKGIQVEAWSNVYQAMFAGAEFRYVY